MKDWVVELKNNTSNNIMIVIVGNKVDLEDRRAVSENVVQNYVRNSDSNIIATLETSAKTGQNINRIFEIISEKLVELCNK